jgi:peptidoglycan-associated lipoprotein
MSRIQPWWPFLIVALAGVGCHAHPPVTAPSRTSSTVPATPPRPPSPPAAAAAPARPAAAPLTEADLFRRKSLDALNAEHPLGDPLFDYDQDSLRDDARRVLQQDAQWLAKWPQTVIRVDGHCDERGTAENNLALGERRADVVKEYLNSLGVRVERIQTRSLGKEAPFCQGSDESCWSQNRRGHFVITAK